MNLTPLRNKVLIQLDTDTRMAGRFFLPDQDFIQYCKDCPSTDPKVRCVPEEIWEDDQKHNRWIPRAIRTEHDIVTVTRQTANGNVRVGTVLSTGRLCRYVESGMRVMIGQTAGGTTEDIRVVSEDTILAAVEA